MLNFTHFDLTQKKRETINNNVASVQRSQFICKNKEKPEERIKVEVIDVKSRNPAIQALSQSHHPPSPTAKRQQFVLLSPCKDD